MNPYELTGEVFHWLTVIERTEKPAELKQKLTYWLCKCKCGKIITVAGSNLKRKRGSTKSCGCLAKLKKGKPHITKPRRKNVVTAGKVLHKLTVIEKTEKPSHVKGHGRYWLCKCECGNLTKVAAGNLSTGSVKSCGCGRFDGTKRRLERSEAGFNLLFRHYQDGSRYRKLCFELDKETFRKITSSNCYYCGIEPSQFAKVNTKHYSTDGTTWSRYIYNGVDRLNNDIGYTVENSVACCKNCNIAKRTLTVEEFLTWIRRVYTHSLPNNLQSIEQPLKN